MTSEGERGIERRLADWVSTWRQEVRLREKREKALTNDMLAKVAGIEVIASSVHRPANEVTGAPSREELVVAFWAKLKTGGRVLFAETASKQTALALADEFAAIGISVEVVDR